MGAEATGPYRVAVSGSRAEVARIGYRGFLDAKVIVIPGSLNKLGVQSLRLGPRAVVRPVTRKLQEE